MADDRMKNDDLQRNMGTSGKEGQDFGKQTPGRQGVGHEGGGQQAGQKGAGQKGYGGGSQHNEPRNMEDDEEFGGGTGKTGGMNRGGQNR